VKKIKLLGVSLLLATIVSSFDAVRAKPADAAAFLENGISQAKNVVSGNAALEKMVDTAEAVCALLPEISLIAAAIGIGMARNSNSDEALQQTKGVITVYAVIFCAVWGLDSLAVRKAGGGGTAAPRTEVQHFNRAVARLVTVPRA
jgi:hypothetical protein